jgi:hypothetical protein
MRGNVSGLSAEAVISASFWVSFQKDMSSRANEGG